MRIVLDSLYLLLLVCALPWLVYRRVRTGRYKHNLRAKLLGRSSIVVPTTQPVAWFHAVSVGEVHLLSTVVAAFRERFPGWHIVVSSTTDTGLAEARKRFGEQAVFAWPLDFSWAIASAIQTIQPKLVILAEAELWPNALRLFARAHVPVVVINARLSDRSYRRFAKLPAWIRSRLFGRLRLIVTQTEEYADRYRALGVQSSSVVVAGSVKYDGALPHANASQKREQLRTLFGWATAAPVLVAGSTHAPEELLILMAYQNLLGEFPNLRLILVPRHPDRFDEVATLIESAGISFVRRSSIVPRTSSPVVLLDTIGELGAAWGLADVGFVGGTFDPKRGGQSMIEPAGYGVPTVFGPHFSNFRDAARRLVEAGGAIMVKNSVQLEAELRILFQNSQTRIAIADAARRLVQSQQGATARTLDALAPIVAHSSSTPRTAAA